MRIHNNLVGLFMCVHNNQGGLLSCVHNNNDGCYCGCTTIRGDSGKGWGIRSMVQCHHLGACRQGVTGLSCKHRAPKNMGLGPSGFNPVLRTPLAYASPVPHVPAAPAPRAALRALWACIKDVIATAAPSQWPRLRLSPVSARRRWPKSLQLCTVAAGARLRKPRRLSVSSLPFLATVAKSSGDRQRPVWRRASGEKAASLQCASPPGPPPCKGLSRHKTPPAARRAMRAAADIYSTFPLHHPMTWLNPSQGRTNSQKDGSAGKQHTSQRRSRKVGTLESSESGSFVNQTTGETLWKT